MSLTERRKAETRMDIARAAAGLFVRRGLKATRAEDIAQAAGIAPRTFYRYFASKEEAIAPLYTEGADRWAAAVRAAPAQLDAPRALEHAVRHTLVPGGGVSAASWEWVRTLIRLADTSPALRRVWAEVCRGAEQTLGEVLGERAEAVEAVEAEAARVEAARVEAAQSKAAQSGAAQSGAAQSGAAEVEAAQPDAAGVEAAEVEAAQVEVAEVEGRDNVADVVAGERFVAAVACAAVRTAVEAWAAGDAPAAGPRGPAALALRNLEALRDFGWGS
jgi:AcrR family transcriptional regulator